MSYLVLARRWRPKRFADLIGQDVVVRTLQNAFQGGNLAHAYLLTGIRGVGKTTIARLMAMAVNCTTSQGGEPCGQCESCQSIMRGSNLDVQEMDAASHTGVDDIREILDGVRYPPTSLQYKVYIIDEAHMLSKSAFNALLKTLEEPPGQVLFILATTESEKLPVTVRSRCQRFDLRKLGMDEIAAYLDKVLSADGFTADNNALQVIARASEGSVRDALSLTERVLAYAGKHVSLDAVHHSLGLIHSELIRQLSDAVFAGDAKVAIQVLRRAMEGGHAPRNLLLSLGEQWHALACVMVDEGLLRDESDELQQQWLKERAGEFSNQSLDLRYQVLIHGLRDLGLVDELRGAEMILIRLSHLHHMDPLPIKALTKSGAATVSAGASPAMAAAPQATAQDAPVQTSAPVVPLKSAGEPASAAPVAAKDEPAPAAVRPSQEAAVTAVADHHQPKTFSTWAEALEAFQQVRVGVAAMLEHAGLIEFGDKVRLSLDAHQQKAITPSDRLEFSEWLGREVYWESAGEKPIESLSDTRVREAEAEKQRLWQQAEHDPHVQLLMKEMSSRLVNVQPPEMGEDDAVQEDDGIEESAA